MNATANTPFELFFDQLRDLYSVEVQLRESMPHLVSLCTNEDLGDLLVSHAHQNCSQIAEIAAIFERHGESPGDDKCKAMAGLIEGGAAHLEEVEAFSATSTSVWIPCPTRKSLMGMATAAKTLK